MIIINVLKFIFSNPGYAGLTGMILFGGMFIILGWLVVSSIHTDKKK